MDRKHDITMQCSPANKLIGKNTREKNKQKLILATVKD